MMNPIEINKLKESAPLPVVLGIIMMLAPWIILDPRLENLAAAEQAFDLNLKTVHNSIVRRAAESEIGSQKNEMETQVDRIERWLTPDCYLPSVIDRFQELARIFSLHLFSVSYRFPRNIQETMPPRVFITLELAGEYLGMRSFLQSLEFFPLPLVPVEISAGNNGAYIVQIMHVVKP